MQIDFVKVRVARLTEKFSLQMQEIGHSKKQIKKGTSKRKNKAMSNKIIEHFCCFCLSFQDSIQCLQPFTSASHLLRWHSIKPKI